MYYKFVLYQCQSCVTILYIITVITEIKIIAILVNNAFKTVQQSANDKEDICRRADARQRYLTQDFTPVSYTHLDVYKRQPIVCSMTLGPANPISEPGSARIISPSMAKLAVTPPVVGSVSTDV